MNNLEIYIFKEYSFIEIAISILFYLNVIFFYVNLKSNINNIICIC